MFTRSRRSEAATILARYRRLIVDGDGARSSLGEPVDVPSIEVLYRLSQQAEQPMRHVRATQPDKDEFHVDDFGVRYRYLADRVHPGPS